MNRKLRAVFMVVALAIVSTQVVPSSASPRTQQKRKQQKNESEARFDRSDTARDDGQHGGEDGHLPRSRKNVSLLGRADIENPGPGRVADVSAFGNYAYLTVRDPEGCSDAGVAIFDISDPTSPSRVGFIEATEGSFPGEGSDILDMHTSEFTGQVLLFNNEICDEAGEGGVSLWDVTNPLHPVVLSANAGDDDPGGAIGQFNEIHSAFGWQAGNRAFVVMTDNDEFEDVDIMEITDPRNPVLVGEFDLNDFGVLQDDAPLGASSFLHDMTVKRINGTWTMLLSYWDGGWVLLDVDDPANPRFIRDSDYANTDPLTGFTPPEGNAHQAEFSPQDQFVIGTDEDFAPYRIETLEITSGPNPESFEAVAVGGGASPALLPDKRLNGPTVYGGYGCPPEDYPGATPVPQRSNFDLDLAPGEEAILVLQRGPSEDPSEPLTTACFPGEKANEAIEAGWDAVVLVNRHLGSPDADSAFCGSGAFPSEPPIVTACTTHEAFHKMFNSEPVYDLPYNPAEEPQIGDEGERVNATAVFDGWGYVRLLERRTMEEIDAYAIDEGLDEDFATGFGNLTVHEVAVDPFKSGLAYLSYYAGGIRVIRYGTQGIREVGHYIGAGGNDFWGVEAHRLPGTHRTLILGSDRDSGLWIFGFTGGRGGGPVRLSADLTGAQEEPGPGDADGTGTALLKLGRNAGEVCYRLSWEHIANPTAAHIHEAPAGQAGGVVVTLFNQTVTHSGIQRCVKNVDPSLIDDIVEDPDGYYVNVHNQAFPGGAIRGQLHMN